MKRLHVHVKVNNLEENIAFYNALFSAQPSVVKSDYAKWMLEDPRVNFAISSGHKKTGIEHLGIQTESAEELRQVYAHMEEAQGSIVHEGETTCCYARSEKSWITDPQGVDWEAFYTHGSSTVYGEGTSQKQAPGAMTSWKESESQKSKREAPCTACRA